MKTRIMLALGLVALLGVGSAYAAQLTAEVLKAKIDFQFTAGGKVLPAGDYEFRLDEGQVPVFRIQGQGKTGALANVITRLAAEIHTTLQDAHVVFDKVGDTYTLSEIWIPGVDGFLLQITKGKHEHKVINIQR
jgi:hypothetical protein